MAVSTGGACFPVHAVVREELELGMADEGQLEPGHVLLPFSVGRIAPDLLDDVLDGDVSHGAALPGEEEAGRMHLLVLGMVVGHMALGADHAPHLLAGQLLLIDPDLLEGLAQRELPGDPERHVLVVMAVDAGDAELLCCSGIMAWTSL